MLNLVKKRHTQPILLYNSNMDFQRPQKCGILLFFSLLCNMNGAERKNGNLYDYNADYEKILKKFKNIVTFNYFYGIIRKNIS